MSLKKRVDKLVVKGKGKDSDHIRTMWILMERFGWTLDELMELPVTTYIILVEELEKEAKKSKEKKKMRNKK